MLTLLACLSVPLPELTLGPPDPVLIHDVAVYPGSGPALVPHQDVLVRDGHIASIGPTAAAPAGVEVVEGAGLTLLPGLVDAHVHLTAPIPPPWAPSLPDPRATATAWLRAGVTTVYDMGGDPKALTRLQAASGPLPRIYQAGGQVSFPGAHPAVVMRDLAGPAAALVLSKLTLVAEPAEAPLAIALLEGDYVKVVYDALPPDAPHMPYNVLAAVVSAAHARGKKVFVHIGTASDALDAARAGADVLAHGVYHGGIDAEQIAALRSVTVVPTLFGFQASRLLVAGTLPHTPLEEAIVGSKVLDLTSAEAGKKLLEYPKVAAFLDGIDPEMGAGVRRMWEGGLSLVVGTDAPLPGIVPGAAVHRELAAWVDAGIPPAVALEGATGRAAALLHPEPDFGTIAVGKVADLLLIRGDPLADIHATEAIVGVYRAGRAVGW